MMVRKYLYAILITGTLMCLLNLSAQQTQFDAQLPAGNKVIIDNAGNYLVSGGASIICLSPWGNTLWSSDLQMAGTFDIFNIVSIGNELTILGTWDSAGVHSTIMFHLDAMHAISWERIYQTGPALNDVTGFLLTSDGEYLFTGYNYSTHADWIIKTDSSGHIVWQKSTTVPDLTGGILLETSDHGYLFWARNGIVFKTDTSLDIQWQRAYLHSSGDNFTAEMSCVELPGGFLFTTSINGTWSWGIGAFKTDRNGNLLASNTYDVQMSDWTMELASAFPNDSFGLGLIAATQHWIANPWMHVDIWQFSLATVDSNSVITWGVAYDNLTNEAQAIQAADGGYLVIGGSATQPGLKELHKTDWVGNNCHAIAVVPPSSGSPLYEDTSAIGFTSAYIEESDITSLSIVSNVPAVSLLCFVGITEPYTDGSVNVYPNPSDMHYFFVDRFNNTIPAEIFIYNSTGELVAQKSSSDSRVEFVIDPEWSAGIYLVKVMSQGEIITRKLIVE